MLILFIKQQKKAILIIISLKNKNLIVILTIIMVLGAMFLERIYTDKWKTEKEYQQGMELIQSHVTKYLIKNYEGIEKIR